MADALTTAREALRQAKIACDDDACAHTASAAFHLDGAIAALDELAADIRHLRAGWVQTAREQAETATGTLTVDDDRVEVVVLPPRPAPLLPAAQQSIRGRRVGALVRRWESGGRQMSAPYDAAEKLTKAIIEARDELLRATAAPNA